MSPALTRGIKKAVRTLAQMAASGALTAAVTALAGGLTPAVGAWVATGWMLVVTFTQNYLESAGAIPTLLPTIPITRTGVTGGGITVDPKDLIGK
jgi:hypothetical protein